MLIQVPPPFRKNRKLPTRVSPPQPAGNHILSAYQVDDEFVIEVEVDSAVAGVIVVDGFQVNLDDAWTDADDKDLSDPLHPQFIFAYPVAHATQWRVPTAENWTFVNGLPLAAPLAGEVG